MSQVSHSPKCYALLCTSVDVSAAFSWLPRMLHAKIFASLELFFRTCFLYLQYSLLPLVCFFLLLLSSSSYFCFRTLLSSEPEDVFTLLSKKADWLACATRRLLYVFRVVRVVQVVRRVVRVVQVVWRVLALYWSYTTGLLYRKFYTPSRFIWTFLPD